MNKTDNYLDKHRKGVSLSNGNVVFFYILIILGILMPKLVSSHIGMSKEVLIVIALYFPYQWDFKSNNPRVLRK